MTERILANSFPLSPLQEGMVFNQMLAPRSGVDIVQMIVELREPVDAERLRACWAEVTRRHEMLRVRFEINPDRANSQLVEPDCAPRFEVRDWTARPAKERARAWADFLRDDRVAGFDLERAPLSRVVLFRFRDNRYRLVWTFFHGTVDGRGVTLVLEELFDLYDREPAAEAWRKPPEFRGYVEWLSHHRFEGDAFWRTQFEGLESATELGMMRPAGKDAPGLHEEQAMWLSTETTDSLRRLCEETGATMNTVTMGAWAILLARCARVDDVVFGVVKTCRRGTIDGAADIVGPLVNTLPMRLRVSDDDTTRRWLGDIRGAWLALRDYEHTPLTAIQEASGFSKDTPLFESVFGFEGYDYTAHFRQRSPERWRTRQIYRTIQTSFPLAVIANDGPRLLFRMDYDPARLSARGALRVLDRLSHILDTMAAEPDRPLGQISATPPSEFSRVVREFNRTDTAVPDLAAAPGQVRRIVASAPHAPAVVDQHGAVSFAELSERADRIASALRREGLGRGDAVGVCLKRHAGMVPAFLGVMNTGAAYAPLDPGHPKARLEAMLAVLGSGVVLTQRQLISKFDGLPVRALAIEDLAGSDGRVEAAEPLGPDDLAYVIFTSGSTGEPKGVEITHGALSNLISWHRRRYALCASDVCTQVAGVGFDACVWELWPALCAGSCVRIVPDEVAADGSALARYFDGQGVTIAFVPTPVAEAMLADPAAWPRGLRAMLTGGDRLSAAPASSPPFRLFNHYGPTENTVVATAGEVEPGAGGPPHIGSAIDNVRVYIVDQALRAVPIEVPGELCIAGAQLARGYRGKPDLTADRFVPCPFEPGKLMYRTGDLVRRRADGAIDFVGRVDDQVKIRGYRIELGDIEAAISRSALVRRAVVVRDDGENSGAALRAFVVIDPDLARSPGHDGAQSDSVDDWRALYDATYAGSETRVQDATFNIIGWNSSYTGEPIPAEEMREWVDAAVDRIRAHRPRRVLEIGCGTGLLLSRLAPECERYVGLDFSQAAIDAVRAAIAHHPELAHAELHRRRADELDGLGDGFDTVVLNSVVQYFPDMEYLVRVIERAAGLVRDGGRIIVGDVRSRPLLEAYHASVLMHRADDALTPAEFRERVARSLAREEELAIDPAAFGAMVGRISRVSAASVALKRGSAHNELTRFRYEAFLAVGGDARRTESPALVNGSPAAIASIRDLAAAGECGVIRGVPNGRLDGERLALAWMRGRVDEAPSLGDLRRMIERTPVGVDPEQVWSIGGPSVELMPASGDDPTCMDIALGVPALVAPPGDSRPWDSFANDPGAGAFVRAVPDRLREELARALPAYMIPTSVTVVDAMPLTRNGKIDRKALLRLAEPTSAARLYARPRTPTEQAIAGAWADLLRIERVGATDNFFELGGHSLLATRLSSMLRGVLGVEVPLRLIFEAPTVEALAEHIDAMRFASGGDHDRPASGREVFEL